MPRCHISAAPQTSNANAIGMPSAIAPISERRKTVVVIVLRFLRQAEAGLGGMAGDQP